jgi:hypothetical protein
VSASQEFLLARYPDLNLRRLKKENIDEFRALVGQIITNDLQAVEKHCDYCICYWDRSAQEGAGTKGKITLAKYIRKPVFIVTGVPLSRVPGWVLGCSSEIFFSFRQLKKFLQSRYGGVPSL